MRNSTLCAVVAGTLCVGTAAWALPAGGVPPPESDAGAEAPPVPAPEPGETAIPPPATAAEDRHIPASAAEKREALERLREVVVCARERGFVVPDPIAVDTGAIYPWPDGAPDAATSRGIEACTPGLAEAGES